MYCYKILKKRNEEKEVFLNFELTLAVMKMYMEMANLTLS